MLGHRITIRPVRVRRYSVPLDVLTSRIVAYRAECSCGKRSPYFGNVRAARAWRKTHEPTE